MIRINLLPWREEQRRQQQRQFGLLALLLTLLTLLVIGWIHLYYQQQLAQQQRRNSLLQREIALVDAQIAEIAQLDQQQQQLLARMVVIEQLQSNRPGIVYLFEELVRAVPDGLYLTRLQQQGETLQIEGVAQSHARVSTLLQALEQSEWFTAPQLAYIQSEGVASVRGQRRFQLQVTQRNPQQVMTPIPTEGE